MNDKNNESQTRQGKMLDVTPEPAKPTETRKARVFTPKGSQALNEIPESITAGESLPHIDSPYSDIHLAAAPTKGVKPFLMALAVMIGLLFGWEVYGVFRELLQAHWVLASGFIVALASVLGLGLKLLCNYIFDPDSLGRLEAIQERTHELSKSRGVEDKVAFLQELRQFYADKPQAPYLQRCLDAMPDYHDDSEVITHIDNVFLKPLDEQVQKCISKHVPKVGAATALSQWAALDMALVFWRNMKMVEDITQIYGIRPTLRNRLRILKKIGVNMAFSGVSQSVMNQVPKIFSTPGAKIASSILGSVGQGVAIAIYTTVIGIAAMEVTRPITLDENEELSVISIIFKPITDWLKKRDEDEDS